MAKRNFTDFTLKTPASGDFLVGYNADGSTEIRTTVGALVSSYIDKADINGGTIDGVAIGSSSPATYLKVDTIELDTGTLRFTSGAGGIINGTQIVIDGGNGSGNITSSTGDDLVLATGNMNPGTARITLDDAANGNITFATNGTGSVVIPRADINGGAIDGTPIGASVASTGRFTSLAATGNVNIDGNLFVSGSFVTVENLATGLSSQNWNSVYSLVREASSNWQSSFEYLNENYDDFSHVIENYNNWDNVYTHVRDVSSNWGSPEFEFSWTTAPAASGDSGTAGQVAYAENYFYICVAPNTWKRSILAAW